MTVIDFHTHIFPPDLIAQRARHLEHDAWFRRLYTNPKSRMATAEELLDSMDRAGIDRAVTFGFAWADPELCQCSNDYVLDALRRYPERLIGFAVVNPQRGECALQEAERCVAQGCQGIGELMPDGQGYSLDEHMLLRPLLDWLAERNLPLLLHSNEPVGHDYEGKGQTTPAQLYRLACAFPQATLICAHWGGGLPLYELMPEVRRALANVYYDTAASLYLYDQAIFTVLDQVCGSKILFGTDYPLIGQKRFLSQMSACALSAASLERILGGNAERLLGRAASR